jgi:hypothetical protein
LSYTDNTTLTVEDGKTEDAVCDIAGSLIYFRQETLIL